MSAAFLNSFPSLDIDIGYSLFTLGRKRLQRPFLLGNTGIGKTEIPDGNVNLRFSLWPSVNRPSLFFLFSCVPFMGRLNTIKVQLELEFTAWQFKTIEICVHVH